MMIIWKNVWTILGSSGAYFFLTLVLPSLCLGKYVKHKTLTFRFFLYQCTGNLYINFVMLILGFAGLVNIISAWTTLIILPLVWTAIRERKALKNLWVHMASTVKSLVLGIYGVRVLFSQWINRFKKLVNQLKVSVKGHKIEILVFLIVIGWLIWFYGWYKFHNTGYGHTDEETHLYWIQSLIHGNMFPAGMYPHGIHTLSAALGVLLPFNITRIYLNFSVLSTVMVFSSAWLLFRQTFKGSCVALIGWLVFVFTTIFQVTTYFRFQMSFPMEFGLVAAFAMIYGLFSYIKSKDKKDLFLFGASITWTLMAHFYITILCLMICLVFGVVYLIPIIKKRVLLPLIAAGIIGVIVACLPYGWGFLNGYEFERSIGWALGIAGATSQDQEESVEETEEIQPVYTPEKQNLLNKLDNIASYLAANYVKEKSVAKGLMILDGALIVVSLLGMIISKRKPRYMAYLFWSVLWFVGAVITCAYYIGIPAIIEAKRMATFLSFLTIPLFSIPLDIMYHWWASIKWKRPYVNYALAVIAIGTTAAFLISDKVKKDLYYTITISEADMQLSLDLCENKQDFMWTVISPTNDLSVIRNNGYHYEMVDLIENLDKKNQPIYIPTPEIYVVSEKQAISFSTDIRAIDRSDVTSPEHVKDLSPELALEDALWHVSEDGLHGADAPYYFQRDMVMSKIYYWIEAVKAIYPNHVTIYAEDDLVVVYKITQDPYFLLNLSVDYQAFARASIGGQ